ncbi:hypothetical protein J6590_079264 [Homalodisca vitripennis]|nr:hypothetical protein J6590_079264 [Homalodisca vitripennis]
MRHCGRLEKIHRKPKGYCFNNTCLRGHLRDTVMSCISLSPASSTVPPNLPYVNCGFQLWSRYNNRRHIAAFVSCQIHSRWQKQANLIA